MDQDELKAAEEAFAGGYDDKPTERPVVEEPAADVQAQAQDEPAPKVDEPQGQEPTAAKPDPLADVLARMDKMQQSHDRLAGTLGSVQHEYRQMQANLAAAQAATGRAADEPTEAEIKRAAADPARWASLKDDAPEWGAATEEYVESRIDARIPKFDATAFEQKVNDAIEGKAQAMQKKIIDVALTSVFPGWKEDVQTPEFLAWFDAQPDAIKASRHSDDVGDVARTLNLYAKHQAAPKPTAAPAPPEPKDTTRKNRLAAAITPKGTGGHAPGRTELDEFEAGYTG